MQMNPEFVKSFAHAPVARRTEILKQLSEAAGLRLPETILPEGTALLPVGEEAKRRMQRELERAAGQLLLAGLKVFR